MTPHKTWSFYSDNFPDVLFSPHTRLPVPQPIDCANFAARSVHQSKIEAIRIFCRALRPAVDGAAASGNGRMNGV